MNMCRQPVFIFFRFITQPTTNMINSHHPVSGPETWNKMPVIKRPCWITVYHHDGLTFTLVDVMLPNSTLIKKLGLKRKFFLPVVIAHSMLAQRAVSWCSHMIASFQAPKKFKTFGNWPKPWHRTTYFVCGLNWWQKGVYIRVIRRETQFFPRDSKVRVGWSLSVKDGHCAFLPFGQNKLSPLDRQPNQYRDGLQMD